MKKLLLTALLTMLCILCAPAQQPGTKPYKEPRVRFGAGYRYSLGVAEKYKATYQSDSGTDKAVSPWGTPDNMRGGELRLEMTIRITPDWNVGAGWGMGMYDKDDWRSQLIYVKAERLYGKRPQPLVQLCRTGHDLLPTSGCRAHKQHRRRLPAGHDTPHTARLHDGPGIPEHRKHR